LILQIFVNRYLAYFENKKPPEKMYKNATSPS
jgi:hypothetical protein